MEKQSVEEKNEFKKSKDDFTKRTAIFEAELSEAIKNEKLSQERLKMAVEEGSK